MLIQDVHRLSLVTDGVLMGGVTLTRAAQTWGFKASITPYAVAGGGGEVSIRAVKIIMRPKATRLHLWICLCKADAGRLSFQKFTTCDFDTRKRRLGGAA